MAGSHQEDKFYSAESELHQEIIMARESKGWTVKQAAEACGYSVQQWRNYEAGDAVPPAHKLETICGVLGMRPIDTLTSWVLRSIRDNESKQMRQEFRSLLNREQEGLENSSSATKKLISSVAPIPLDWETAHLASKLIDRISKYRKSLSAKFSRRPKVLDLNTDSHKKSWDLINGYKHLAQKQVSLSREGVGYLFTTVRIDPGWGVYHKQDTTEYLDAGVECFTVIHGAGLGFFELPRQKSYDWEAYQLGVGSTGSHRGDQGHVFVNHGPEPLILSVACFPAPPSIQAEKYYRDSHGVKHHDGFEFDINKVDSAKFPETLKTLIRQMLVGDKTLGR